MKKILLVLAVLALGSLASAQTFGFASIGSGLYCNYEQLVNNGYDVYSGIDNLSACGLTPFNAAIVGFTAPLAASSGLPVHGAGIDVGDGIYDAEFSDIYYYTYPAGVYSGLQWTVHSALKCNKQNKYGYFKGAYSWIGVAGSDYGYWFGDNYGYLSCTIYSKDGNAVSKGPTVGKPTGQFTPRSQVAKPAAR